MLCTSTMYNECLPPISIDQFGLLTFDQGITSCIKHVKDIKMLKSGTDNNHASCPHSLMKYHTDWTCLLLNQKRILYFVKEGIFKYILFIYRDVMHNRLLLKNLARMSIEATFLFTVAVQPQYHVQGWESKSVILITIIKRPWHCCVYITIKFSYVYYRVTALHIYLSICIFFAGKCTFIRLHSCSNS